MAKLRRKPSPTGSSLVVFTRKGLYAEHMHKDNHMLGFYIIIISFFWSGSYFIFLNTKILPEQTAEEQTSIISANPVG